MATETVKSPSVYGTPLTPVFAFGKLELRYVLAPLSTPEYVNVVGVIARAVVLSAFVPTVTNTGAEQLVYV